MADLDWATLRTYEEALAQIDRQQRQQSPQSGEEVGSDGQNPLIAQAQRYG